MDKCSIIVEKSKRTLTLNSNKVSLIYSIRLGQNPIGNKEFEGDNKTPEGNYKIIFKNPKSAYHLGLKINYPNKDDIKRIKKAGKKPGGNIFIHGQKKNADHTYVSDWTSGCIALSNKDMDELYKKVSLGCKITIKK